jgi:hypothetical protein
MVDNFNEFTKELSPEEMKNAIKEAYRSQLSGLLGPKETKEALANKSMQELNALLYDCPGTSKEKIMSLRLSDLDDLDDQNELMRIGENFNRSVDALNGFRTDDKNSFLNGSKRYYWIPQSLLP